jgi:hypothetical protein
MGANPWKHCEPQNPSRQIGGRQFRENDLGDLKTTERLGFLMFNLGG